MNIGILTPYYPDKNTQNSGLANHFHTLAHVLTSMGNTVTVIHIRPGYAGEDAQTPAEEIDEKVILLTFKVTLNGWLSGRFKNNWAVLDVFYKITCMLKVFFVLSGIIKRHKLDIIETTSYFSLAYFYMFRKQHVPLVVRVSTLYLQMLNDYYPFQSRVSNLFGRLELLQIKKSKHLITHAYSHANEIRQLYNLAAEKFTIIPHGITLPELVPNHRSRSPFVKILYVGRFEYRKGTDVLLSAIPLTLKINSNLVFELIGLDTDHYYENKFKKENDRSITDQVFFRGQSGKTDLENAYNICDIFVAPSRYESFGLIFIEAMSYGKPVIGCAVGGVSEIIEDGVNGLFAQSGSAESLTEKIILLADNFSGRNKMGANARESVEEKYTDKILAVNSIAYYKMVIQAAN